MDAPKSDDELRKQVMALLSTSPSSSLEVAMTLCRALHCQRDEGGQLCPACRTLLTGARGFLLARSSWAVWGGCPGGGREALAEPSEQPPEKTLAASS